jgi:flavin-binding protein dodecin
MGEKVFKKVNVTGCSSDSYEKAIEAAVEKAAESLHGMAWFEVTELRGAIKDGKTSEWQATIQVAFKVD